MPWISNHRLEAYLHDAYRLGFLAAAAVALDAMKDEQPKGNSGVRLDEGFVADQRNAAPFQ